MTAKSSKELQIDAAYTGVYRWWDGRKFKLLKDRERLCERQNWRCCYCGIRMQLEVHFQRDSATLEHVVPRSLGGPDDEGNIVMACYPCNHERADKFFQPHFELLDMYERGEIA